MADGRGVGVSVSLSGHQHHRRFSPPKKKARSLMVVLGAEIAMIRR
jgi:hypothetical protein